MKAIKKVLVIGDVMLDQYYWGETSRISPEAPVPVVNLNNIENRLGGAANVALNIAHTGANVKVFGYIGEDASGNALKKILYDNKIDHNFISGTNPTTTKLRVMSMGQQLLRIDTEAICSKNVLNELIENFEKDIDNAGLVVVSDYSKGVISDIKEIISKAAKNSIPVIVDPKSNDIENYRSAFLITPNLKEFKNFIGYDQNKTIYENALLFSNTYDIDWFVVTLGSEGMMAVNKDGRQYSLNTESKDVIDVTGAGDTVLAYLAHGILHDHSMTDSLILANKAAAISVSILGSASVKIDDLTSSDRKIIYNLSAIDEFMKNFKEKYEGKKVVMTNGCFDIIHPGHVDYLKKSKNLGDILIVAVNSDRSISSIKGSSRPINSFDYRSKVLSSLEAVDLVVEFDEDTPENLIKNILPDVLTKGSDYDISEIAGSHDVISNGGEVVLIDLVKGHSTSSVLSKISKSD